MCPRECYKLCTNGEMYHIYKFKKYSERNSQYNVIAPMVNLSISVLKMFNSRVTQYLTFMHNNYYKIIRNTSFNYLHLEKELRVCNSPQFCSCWTNSSLNSYIVELPAILDSWYDDELGDAEISAERNNRIFGLFVRNDDI